MIFMIILLTIKNKLSSLFSIIVFYILKVLVITATNIKF